MNIKQLQVAHELLGRLVDTYSLLTNSSLLELTAEERRHIIVTRIKLLQETLRATGIVAAVEKPESLRSLKPHDRVSSNPPEQRPDALLGTLRSGSSECSQEDVLARSKEV